MILRKRKSTRATLKDLGSLKLSFVTRKDSDSTSRSQIVSFCKFLLSFKSGLCSSCLNRKYPKLVKMLILPTQAMSRKKSKTALLRPLKNQRLKLLLKPRKKRIERADGRKKAIRQSLSSEKSRSRNLRNLTRAKSLRLLSCFKI